MEIFFPIVIARLLASRGDPGEFRSRIASPLDCRSRLRLLRNDKRKGGTAVNRGSKKMECQVMQVSHSLGDG